MAAEGSPGGGAEVSPSSESSSFAGSTTGLMKRVHSLEAEVSTLRDRCSRLEAECHILHEHVRDLETGRRDSEIASRRLAEELRKEVKALARQVHGGGTVAPTPQEPEPQSSAPQAVFLPDMPRRRRASSPGPTRRTSSPGRTPCAGDLAKAEAAQLMADYRVSIANGRQDEAFESGGATPSQPLRSARLRQATGYPEPDEGGCDTATSEQSSAAPSLQDNTPSASPSRARVSFCANGVSIKEIPGRDKEGTEGAHSRSSGSQSAHSQSSQQSLAFFVGHGSEEVQVTCVASNHTIEEGDDEWDGIVTRRLSSVRFVDGGDETTDGECVEELTSSEEEDTQDPDMPRMRPSRARVPTAFPRDEVTAAEDEGSLSPLVQPTRKKRVRLPTAFARRECVRLDSEQDGLPAANSPDCSHLDLNRYLVPGGAKDKKVIEQTLTSLYFFREMEKATLAPIVGAMQLFAFEDGVEVFQEGVQGTHFFIVADGIFVVERRGEAPIEISTGAAFGESVVLLSVGQKASIRAKGHVHAYGLSGVLLRKILQNLYQDDHKDVIRVVNEVLSAGTVSMFQSLTPYQIQCLHDSAQTQSFVTGDVLQTAGQLEFGPLYVMTNGRANLLGPDGTQLRALEPFTIVGDQGLLFQEVPFTVVAEGPVETLKLTRSLLEDMFADRLHTVLLTGRLLELLVQHETFSALGAEQLQAVAEIATIVDVPLGTTIRNDKVRMAMCLHGVVEAERLQGGDCEPERADAGGPDTHRLSGAIGDLLGEKELSVACSPWSFCAMPGGAGAAAGTPGGSATGEGSVQCAKLAVWVGARLEGILGLGKLRRQDLQHFPDESSDDMSPDSPGDGGYIVHSASMKLAVLHDDKAGALKKVVVLRTLSPEQLMRLAEGLVVVFVEPGEVVFSQGEEAKEFYIIHRGQVEITIGDRRVRTLGIGDYVGERALLYSEPRSATVKAMESSELWKMSSEAFHRVVKGPILDYMKDRIAFQNTNVELSQLQCMRVVGRGGFGVVKMVKHPETLVRYALKAVNISQAVEQRQQKALALERSILAELDHPFIIKFVRSFRGNTHVYFLMELVTGGELLDALYALGLLNRSQAQFYVGAITLALEFLHERQIAYLDLKGENCLIDQHGYLKLIDFGVAERVKNGRIHAVKGTPLFMAPEVILGKGYTMSADLWSLGVCVYDFLIGKFPFADDKASNAEVFRAILKMPLRFSKSLDYDTKALIKGLLTRDPAERLGCGYDGYTAMKEHAFFSDFSWDGLLARQLTPPFIPRGEIYSEGEVGASEGTAEEADDVIRDQLTAAAEADPENAWLDEF